MTEEIEKLQKYQSEVRLFEKRLLDMLNDLSGFRAKCQRENILNSKALKELNEIEDNFINYSGAFECFESEIKNQLNSLLEEENDRICQEDQREMAEYRNYCF
jgi:hypothetical protein